ncbi:MAG: 3'-5' exonuclease [Saprospiraceae bacterium]|nr:3'-5' exonuclease [Saprospiraceae bacterium]
MEFNIDKDLVFFDVEATGLNVLKDRILQIALIKYTKKLGEPVEKMYLINPGVPISDEAIAVHGITPEMLKNKPLFSQVGKEILDFIGDADLAGYNSDRFDIPMLMEEFHRVGLHFSIEKRRLIDVQKIFYKMEPRTLKAAYKYYCKSDLMDAHDAMNDVKATIAVLKGQLSMYEDTDYTDADGNVVAKPVKNDMSALADFTNNEAILDVTQRLKYNTKGEVVFNFGKYIGQPVKEVFIIERNYYNWIMEKDFSAQVKQIVEKIYKEEVLKR